MRRTPLHALHAAAAARFVDFGGWEMPVQYAGIAAEHQAVRRHCGLFDVSHMGRLRIRGADAPAWLDRVVCRRCSDLAIGQTRYGMLLADDGGVIDDVLVAREAADAFHMVINAGNRDGDLAHLRSLLARAVAIDDLSDAQAMIAVQGPAALALLAGLGLDGRDLKAYRFRDLPWRGTKVRVSRTGYTGEDGAECFAPAERIGELWQALIAAGAVACGLGARDTLRLEAAMPLHGHELDRSTTPREAGLDFALNPAGGYLGAAGVAQPLRKRLVGLGVPSKRVPRQGSPVLAGARPIGVVTSGTLSPTLGRAIGMAFVAPDQAAPGTVLAIDLRGTRVEAVVESLPFYRRAT